MIVCVCLNCALDVTYDVDRLVPGGSHRVQTVREQAGGKGVNVARVLTRLGAPSIVAGFAGGVTGGAVIRDLDATGIPHRLTPTAAETRRTVAVSATDDTTLFNEPGGPIERHEWSAFLDSFDDLCRDADAVTLSGSLPRGVAPAAYGELTEIAHEHGKPVLLDADGYALLLGIEAAPELITPNHLEVGHLLGSPVATSEDAVSAARTLITLGPRAVVVTRGAEGLTGACRDKVLTVEPGVIVQGNPTGAGDALAAVLAQALADDTTDWPTALREAVAVSAGTVACPVAGDYSSDVAARVRQAARVREH